MAAAPVGVLRAELESRGLSQRAAGRLAALLVAEHPLTCRNGWQTVCRGLERGGLEPAPAREMALTLLAFELLCDGSTYPAVVARLDALRLGVGEARGAAHDALRMHRASGRVRA